MKTIERENSYELRYGKNHLNFARTTEGANVFSCMPFADELVRFPEIEYLAITSAGQALDSIALMELQRPGDVKRIDLVDYNPCQLAFVARLLWVITTSDTHDEAIKRLLSATPDDVRLEWQFVFEKYPELEHLIKHPDIQWDDLNRNLAGIVSGGLTDAHADLRQISPSTLRLFALSHEPLFLALKRLTATPNLFHFHETSMEHFSHPEGRQYHAIYSSDIHAWTPAGPLITTIQDQLVPGGIALFAFFGSSTPDEKQEHIIHDGPFLAEVAASHAFCETILSPQDIQKRMESIRTTLGIEKGPSWDEFMLNGYGATPIKQANVLRIVKKKIHDITI